MKAYASRQLTVHEKNYPIHDLELAAMLFALTMKRHYLYGVHVDVYTEHKSLQYAFTQMELNLRQRRSLKLFKDYDMSVLCNPRKAIVVAYALSRMNMVSLSYIDEDKKDLVNDVRRFSRFVVRLEDSPNGGFTVHNNSELSSVVEVKSKQHLNKPLMELKKSVLGKLNELFSLGGWCFEVPR